jgi:hypothetical protein
MKKCNWRKTIIANRFYRSKEPKKSNEGKKPRAERNK